MLQSMYEDSVEGLCIFIRRMLRRVAAEKFEIEKDLAHLPVPIPYLFTTPKVNLLFLMYKYFLNKELNKYMYLLLLETVFFYNDILSLMIFFTF